MELDELLKRLREFVARHPTRALFRTGASDAAIAAAEAAAGIQFPEPYKQFLRCFDGGYISLVGETSDPDWNEPGAAWNSNVLFGIERLVAEYTEQKDIWRLDLGWHGNWLYLPFCHTEGQELLVFAPPTATGEQPVLDCFHELGPEEWGILYPNFEAFLTAYLEGEGRVRTIA